MWLETQNGTLLNRAQIVALAHDNAGDVVATMTAPGVQVEGDFMVIVAQKVTVEEWAALRNIFSYMGTEKAPPVRIKDVLRQVRREIEGGR